MSESIHDHLLSLADEEYRAFQSRLLPGIDHILGVRLPKLRRLACEKAKGDWRDWLAHVKNQSFEETMLEGMVIGYVSGELEEILYFIGQFIEKIDNWSICDSFCSGLKLAKVYPDQMWKFCIPFLADTREFAVRFGVVMLLFYFSDGSFLEPCLNALAAVHHDGYYAKMAVAWAFSICCVHNPQRTIAFLQKTTLDPFILKKTIQKIKESHAISDADKQAAQALAVIPFL